MLITVAIRTYNSFREAGARANKRNILETSLMDGKITHCSREREREREREVTNTSMQPMEAAKCDIA